MTHNPHDEFVKEYLPELYKDYGIVTPSFSVSSEVRQVDVYFEPTKEVPTTPETLGLLGKLAQKPCLLEVYRNPVQLNQVRECLSKLLDIQQRKIKEAKRINQSLKEDNLPFLWIISPTISDNILSKCEAKARDNWSEGVYFLSEMLNTGLVAIHQLPVNRNTLWLRILGRGKVQEKAIKEVQTLPSNYHNRDLVLELIYGLWTRIQDNQKETPITESEDKELMMSLRSLFQEKLIEVETKGRQDGRFEGIQEGRQEGFNEGLQKEISLVIRQLSRKVGNLSPELEIKIRSLTIDKIENLGEALLDFTSHQDLIIWLDTH
jgi:hypothetical protein